MHGFSSQLSIYLPTLLPRYYSQKYFNIGGFTMSTYNADTHSKGFMFKVLRGNGYGVGDRVDA